MIRLILYNERAHIPIESIPFHGGSGSELSMGPFCVTRSNPTHQLTDPTQPNLLQVEKSAPNPIQLTMELITGCAAAPALC